MTLLDLAGNRDGGEDDNDDLHEAWDEDDHHQGEDLRGLHDPGVRGGRLRRLKDEGGHGPPLDQLHLSFLVWFKLPLVVILWARF